MAISICFLKSIFKKNFTATNINKISTVNGYITRNYIGQDVDKPVVIYVHIYVLS